MNGNLIFFFGVIFMLSLVSPLETGSFTTTTPENISFSTPGNITRNISLIEDANVTRATFSVMGWNYKDFDDTEDAWGNDTGITNLSNAVDEDWNTSAYTTVNGLSTYVYENITIPSGIVGAEWISKSGCTVSDGSTYGVVYYWNYTSGAWQGLQTNYYNVTHNNSLPISDDGLSTSPLQIKTLIKDASAFGIACRGLVEYYEGAVNWLYEPNDANAWSNGTRIYNYTGAVSTKESSIDFLTQINNDLAICSAVDGNCTIPIIFGLNTSGVLEVSDLNITWEEYISPNVEIVQPNGSKATTEIFYNLTISDNHLLNLCKIWVTRGASIEVANTTINCNETTGNVYVSSRLTDYVFHLYAEDYSGNSNYTNETFSTTADAVIVTAGGGGGGGAPTYESPEEISYSCGEYSVRLKEEYANFIKDSSLDNFIKLWNSFWDASICDSAGSIVPIV